MALVRSPVLDRGAQGSTTAPAAVSKLAVLRGRRTRCKTKLQAELDSVLKIERVDDNNRREVLTTRAQISSRMETLQHVADLIASHPTLRDDEVEREVEEAEAAMDIAHAAKAAIEALLQGQSSDASSSSSPESVDAAIQRAISNVLGDVSRLSRPSAATTGGGSSSTSTAKTTGAAATGEGQSPPSNLTVNNGSLSSATGITTNGFTTVSACSNSRLYLDTTPEVFDGSVSRYKLWRSQFMNYVRRRTEATGSDKLVAMCKLLQGAPKDLICALPLIDSNFEVAVSLLDQNYDVPELHQRDVLGNIVSVPLVRHSGDTTALRELLNVTQRTILSLEALNVPLHSIALPYEQTIRKALPVDLILNFEERYALSTSGDAEQTDQAHGAATRLKELLELLRRYTALRERVTDSDSRVLQDRNSASDSGGQQTADKSRDKNRDAAKHPPRPQGNLTAAAATSSTQRRDEKKRQNPCILCKGSGHLPSECTVQMTVQARRDILAQRKRCPSCFRFEHSDAQQCLGPKEACRICSDSTHYTVMHETTPSTTECRQSTAASITQPVAAVSSTRALVMTAAAFVRHGGRKIRVRCFIDSGSMVTFATTRLIRQLPEIRPQSRVKLNL